MNLLDFRGLQATLGKGDQAFCLPPYRIGFCPGGLNATVIEQFFDQITPQSLSMILTASEFYSGNFMSHSTYSAVISSSLR
jgi:hypothetical protein